MVLLKTSDPKGSCFIETKNLDGETNLKIKSVQKDLNEYCQENMENIKGQILSEKPNNAIYNYEGVFNLDYNRDFSLGADNLLLRGSSLRNTEYAYGMTVFTGHDTKIMKNSAKSKMKQSQLEVQTNFAILMVMASQIVMSTIAGLFGASFVY